MHCESFTRGAEIAARSSLPAQRAEEPRWREKYEQCRKLEAYYLAHVYVSAKAPPAEQCGKTDVKCQVDQGVKEAIAAGFRSGIQGMVDLVVQGAVWLLGKLAAWVFDTTSFQVDDAFYWVYNQLSGLMLGLVLVFFLVSVIINGMRVSGPGPVATLGGLVRAFLGISFAGGIAWTITKAWDEATNELIAHASTTQWNARGWIDALNGIKVDPGADFVAFIIALLAIIGLILLFITMTFRGLLVVGAALFGAMAMTGQVMSETRSWGRKWFWTVNALASSKFFIVALWIYGSKSGYESNNLMTALKAVLMIWLMVVAPGVLLRLTSMWDGYLSDVNARGVLSSVADAANIGDKIGQSGGSGKGSSASDIMESNSNEIPTNPTEGMDKVGDPAGLDGGPGAEAGAAAGEMGEEQPDASGAGEGHDDGGHPNSDEAEGVQSGAESARHDVGDAELTAPDGSSGGGPGGSVPLAPGGGSDSEPSMDPQPSSGSGRGGSGGGEGGSGGAAGGGDAAAAAAV